MRLHTKSSIGMMPTIKQLGRGAIDHLCPVSEMRQRVGVVRVGLPGYVTALSVRVFKGGVHAAGAGYHHRASRCRGRSFLAPSGIEAVCVSRRAGGASGSNYWGDCRGAEFWEGSQGSAIEQRRGQPVDGATLQRIGEGGNRAQRCGRRQHVGADSPDASTF